MTDDDEFVLTEVPTEVPKDVYKVEPVGDVPIYEQKEKEVNLEPSFTITPRPGSVPYTKSAYPVPGATDPAECDYPQNPATNRANCTHR